MGIHGLTKLLGDECPDCIKEFELDGLTGRKVAIDASMAMYQFLIAVRSGSDGVAAQMLTNEAGDVTSHIQGMFNRTIRLLTSGVKPVYVFDGKPPTLKGGELAKRAAKRAKAEVDLKAAEDSGVTDDVDKFSKRLVRVTPQHNEDCKQLLRLMGVPVIDASCEAEAQCAALAAAGVVYGTGTEDMDALTFRTPKLLRKMTFSQSAKQPIMEVDYAKVLSGLGLTHEEFVDLCILCGCDYTDSIKGIGPKKALAYIKQYHSIENLLKHLDRSKFTIPADWLIGEKPEDVPVPSTSTKGKKKVTKKAAAAAAAKDSGDESDDANAIDVDSDADEQDTTAIATDDNDNTAAAAAAAATDTEKSLVDAVDTTDGQAPATTVTSTSTKLQVPMYQEARRLFLQPDVNPPDAYDLKWTDPDEAGLTAFLVEKMQFNADRVAAGIKKLKEARKKGGQMRMDSFFKAKPVAEGSGSSASGAKRKPEPAKKGSAKGGAKGGAKGKAPAAKKAKK